MKLMGKKPCLLGGREQSVPAYYEGQFNGGGLGVPDHYVTREEAARLKSAGEARAINRGKAILMLRERKPIEPAARDSVKDAWRVVGQTSRVNIMHKFSRVGPGCPHMELV